MNSFRNPCAAVCCAVSLTLAIVLHAPPAIAEPLIYMNGTPAAVPVAFSPDGKYLAAPNATGGIDLWDVASAKIARTTAPRAGGDALSFSPNGKLLASADGDGHVRLWDTAAAKIFADLQPARRDSDPNRVLDVTSVEFSPDGKTLMAAGYSGICLWDVESKKRAGQLKGAPDDASFATFSPDGKRIVVIGNRYKLMAWDATTKSKIADWKPPDDDYPAVAFTPDGKLIAAGSYDGNVEMLDAPTGRRVRTFKRDVTPRSPLLPAISVIQCVRFSPDGKKLVSIDRFGPVRVWDVAKGECIDSLGGGAAVFTCPISISPDSKTLAVYYSTWKESVHKVVLFDLSPLKEVKRLPVESPVADK